MREIEHFIAAAVAKACHVGLKCVITWGVGFENDV
jgi:hypothetical protein